MDHLSYRTTTGNLGMTSPSHRNYSSTPKHKQRLESPHKDLLFSSVKRRQLHN